ncbi:hypothetical protein E1A91_D11G248100v1 [Gossypium mustelinum]|uniref:Uncharacterized protein n=1 Tax=Gossypium mustelinum TaxID=34275 RepID=A0A5D2SVF3_GOSMU|nr:hypothetical protein E1A91_D11G248100v1 [Gossypium mustelinum]
MEHASAHKEIYGKSINRASRTAPDKFLEATRQIQDSPR